MVYSLYSIVEGVQCSVCTVEWKVNSVKFVQHSGLCIGYGFYNIVDSIVKILQCTIFT